MNLIRTLSYYWKTKNHQSFHSKEELKKWQDKKVKKHLKFVLKKSPFYRKLYEKDIKEKGIESWRTFPTISKKEMMESFDELNTRGIKKEEAFDIALKAENTRDFSPKIKDITIGLSSGTSGNRGLFLASDKEREIWAGTVLAKVLPNGIMHKEKIAFFLRANSNLYETVHSKQIQFRFFDLLYTIEKHIESLNEFMPTILIAPPSVIRILAERKIENQLFIEPKKIIAVAEVLEPLDKQYISEAFKQEVHQVYQCTEGFLATTCKHGTIHLNEDLVVIEKEFLDEEKMKFSPIITDFSRTTQPILRYRLNDILTLKKEPCPCGSVFTAIEHIEGRCDDIFYFYHQEKEELVKVFPDFVRRAIITSSLSILEYKAIQHDMNQIEIQLLVKNQERETEIKKETKHMLELFLQEQKCQLPNIIFAPYQKEYGPKKLKRIERRPFSIEK